MPKEPVREGLLTKPRAKADEVVLSKFADLADRLGFESSEITALKNYSQSTTREESKQSGPLLVTDGPGEVTKQRCGLPRTKAYERDRKFAFIDNIHDEREEQGKGITSFFILRSKYFAFFGRSTWTGTNASLGNPNHLLLGSAARPDPKESTHLIREDTSCYRGSPEYIEEDVNSLFVPAITTEEVDVMQETSEQEELEYERWELTESQQKRNNFAVTLSSTPDRPIKRRKRFADAAALGGAAVGAGRLSILVALAPNPPS